MDILPDVRCGIVADVSPEEAIAIQKRLRAEISLAERVEPITLDQIHTVAGVHPSYREIGRAAIAVFSFSDLTLIEQ